MKATHWSMTGAALVLALAPWTAAYIRADEAEDKAVKAIEKMGGSFTRDEKAKDKPIVRVFLDGTPVTDGGLKASGPGMVGGGSGGAQRTFDVDN
jgi:hypothetical protein